MLSALGVEYRAVSTEVDELREGAPDELVLENARRKALAGRELAPARPGDLVLGVDTEVFLEGRALGKAATEIEAEDRLRMLSGRTHEVLSGVVLLDADRVKDSTAMSRSTLHSRGSRGRSGVARSLVTFIDLDDQAVSRYLASDEWRDRAGAYAIQGLGSTLIARLEGDFSNVVGLPLQLLLELAPELFPAISSESEGSPKNP
jgi:septum formation protein